MSRTSFVNFRSVSTTYEGFSISESNESAQVWQTILQLEKYGLRDH